MIPLIIFISILILGFVVGSIAERRHYCKLLQREALYFSRPAVTTPHFDFDRIVHHSTLVSGSVVISVDYFKRIIAGVHLMFGGELRSYSTLLERARREAILRMKEQAPYADIYINCRLQTSSISQGQQLGSIEIIAYATAITYAKG